MKMQQRKNDFPTGRWLMMAKIEWKTKEEIELEERKLSESDMHALAILELAMEIEKLKGGN